MSIWTSYSCNNCNFSYLAGYGRNYMLYQFHAICKSCWTDFLIYSEDLGYLNPETPCFLHTECVALDSKYTPLDRTEERQWKRRIKRAKKEDKKQVKLERSRLKSTRIHNILVEKVKSGILLEVTKLDTGWRVNLDKVNCFICNTLGKIALGFQQNEICPRSKQGMMSSFI